MISICNPPVLFLLLLVFIPSVSFDHFTRATKRHAILTHVVKKWICYILLHLLCSFSGALPVSAAPLELKSNLATQQPNLIHSLIKKCSVRRRYRAKTPPSPCILTLLLSPPPLISVNKKPTQPPDIPVNPQLNR